MRMRYYLFYEFSVDCSIFTFSCISKSGILFFPFFWLIFPSNFSFLCSVVSISFTSHYSQLDRFLMLLSSLFFVIGLWHQYRLQGVETCIMINLLASRFIDYSFVRKINGSKYIHIDSVHKLILLDFYCLALF